MLLIGQPLHLVAVLCVTDSMTIWTDLARLDRIGRLSLRRRLRPGRCWREKSRLAPV
jgi:hypothetical protein